MRERQTVVLLHPGPGFDHGLFKVQLGPWLSAGTQVVYTRSARRRPQRPEHAGGAAGRALGGRRQAISATRSGSSGRSCSGSASARWSRSGTPPAIRTIPARSCSARRSRAWSRSCRSRSTSASAARTRARSRSASTRAMDEQGFADFLRVCFPLLSSYALTSDVIARADWNPEVLMEWMRGEAKELDLRERARRDPRAGARAGRGGGRVGAARVGAGGLRAARRAQALPQLSPWRATRSSATRPRRTRTCGSSSTTSRRWRCDVKVAVNGVELFFDVEGAKVARTGRGCATGRR